jgi:ribonuclease HII
VEVRRQRIAGVDEVGAGPLAGPVVAAAVVFRARRRDLRRRRLEEDRPRRARAYRLRRSARAPPASASAWPDVGEIDRLNIYHAAMLAMRRAIDALPAPPEHVLVDARTIPNLSMPQNPFNKGDGINFSIAAASIVAKTYRDGLMDELDRLYPDYGFAKHKGYSTPEHQDAIRRLGPCAIHRISFTFIKELCGEYSPLFYELKGRFEQARTVPELNAFEQKFKERRAELAENEERKIKLLISRRWKIV